MEGVEKQPHIHLTKKEMTPVVMVVGDPGRAALVASMCEKSKELAFNREYRTFQCSNKGASFLVTSHGVGSAGCAICFEELIHLGAKVIIRAGTAGTLQPKVINQGDVVVCYAAAREDGHSLLFAPSGFPAVADPSIFQALKDAAIAHGQNPKFGITLSSDLFYKSPSLESTLPTWQKAGVDIVEMEASTLFCIAKARNIKAGALCAIDGCPLQWGEGDYDPAGTKVADGKKHMLQIAIECVSKLSKEHKSCCA